MEEVLIGSRRYLTPYEILFKQNVTYKELCKKILDKDKIMEFSEAVHDEYYIEFLMDELPFWIHIGEVKNEDLVFGHLAESRHFLYTHINFDIGYNEDQIIYVNATTPATERTDVSNTKDRKIKDNEPMEITFSYTVRWIPCKIPYEERLNTYFNVFYLYIIFMLFFRKDFYLKVKRFIGYLLLIQLFW